VSVILEFAIGGDEFALGRALGGHGERRVELERIIPVDESLIPFFWVEAGDQSKLRASVEESSYIENLSRVDLVGEYALYRVAWTGETGHLLDGIRVHDATILEGHASDRWQFRLRFLRSGQVGQFHNYCSEFDIPIEVERVYPLTEDALQGRTFDLTPEQREAMLLALDAGYFEIPRSVTLEELAADLGISQQAASERLRRATVTVVENAVLT